MSVLGHQRVRVLLALAVTAAAIHFIPDRIAVLVPLIAAWGVLFHPLTRAEFFLFALASVVFLFQNYAALRAGIFEFRFKDILLMPYYEPLLWGLYFLVLKRCVIGTATDAVRIERRTIAGVVVTSLMFSLSTDSATLFLATLASTTFLFVLFHARRDWAYALAALALGFVVELFGVSTGLWRYPDPDFLGMPYWFATMWVSVGLLVRRFAIPAAEWLARRSRRQPT